MQWAVGSGLWAVGSVMTAGRAPPPAPLAAAWAMQEREFNQIFFCALCHKQFSVALRPYYFAALMLRADYILVLLLVRNLLPLMKK